MKTNNPEGMSQKTGAYLVKRWLLAIILIIAVVGFGILIAIPPMILSPDINKHVDFSKVYSGSDYDLDVQELVLDTEDGVKISAFEVAIDEPHGVIIFISGIHNPSVTAFLGHSKVLKEHGYASILVDLRAHGKSEGDVIGLGYTEIPDIKAVVDYIKGQRRYLDLPIVVYGVSMGGVVAINSAGQIPEIAGVISLSAYSSWEDVFVDNMSAMGVPHFFGTIQKPFVRLYCTYKYGFKAMQNVPKKQIGNLSERPVLLMHSLEDTQVPFHSLHRIVDNASDHVEVFVRKGDFHFISTDFMHPENDPEYLAMIVSFLDRNFGSPGDS
ncbi:MAG: alpha/beta hydrolase [Bacillota bacterium]|nr:alpha/beta hydrolase [Bacillota bacterium]HHU62239.1 alpha/beta hydrolase [Natronincola sp.]HZK02751.1 alpha/beta hydrolase [Anaerovoracaceae bacterium]